MVFDAYQIGGMGYDSNVYLLATKKPIIVDTGTGMHLKEILLQLDKHDALDEIDKIIFNELCLGIFNKSSKNRIIEITKKYKTDGVILGCTELPLILSQKDTKAKLLDTVELHVESALKYYLSLE